MAIMTSSSTTSARRTFIPLLMASILSRADCG
jgi:hypothetical protein